MKKARLTMSTKLKFGKYVGETIFYLLKKDKDYVKWLSTKWDGEVDYKIKEALKEAPGITFNHKDVHIKVLKPLPLLEVGKMYPEDRIKLYFSPVYIENLYILKFLERISHS
jgi:hypothetical protein